MNRGTLARLERLEGAKDVAEPICVVRVIINPDRTEVEPEAYCDRRGHVWSREAGESLEAFRERAAASALAASPRGRSAGIIPGERIGL
jgi:hypothetical protein